jgi:type II secretory pathway component PulC
MAFSFKGLSWFKKKKSASEEGLGSRASLGTADTSMPLHASGNTSQREGPHPALSAFVSAANWAQVRLQPISRQFNWTVIRNCGFIVLLSFVVASSVSTFAANFVMGLAVQGKKGNSPSSKSATDGAADAGNDVTLMSGTASTSAGGPSGAELKRSIMMRNVFNSEGIVPPEAEDLAAGVKKTKDLDFAAVVCKEETLPVAVVGTIFTGNPFDSFVTVKDPKIADTDTYKAGAVVIDHEDYEVYKVNRGSVEFRKGDEKICIALKGFEDKKPTPAAGASAEAPSGPKSVRPENVETLEFDANLVQQEIGPGYANILNSAKLIPDVDGTGKVTGFKIIAISSGSLFDKMKLQNGDVINEVNGVNLQDASQGFKLYQALQEDREITVKLTRSGETHIRKVNVK